MWSKILGCAGDPLLNLLSTRASANHFHIKVGKLQSSTVISRDEKTLTPGVTWSFLEISWDAIASKSQAGSSIDNNFHIKVWKLHSSTENIHRLGVTWHRDDTLLKSSVKKFTKKSGKKKTKHRPGVTWRRPQGEMITVRQGENKRKSE